MALTSRGAFSTHEQLFEHCQDLLQASETFVCAVDEITGFSDIQRTDTYSPLAPSACARVSAWHRSFVQQFVELHQGLPDGVEKRRIVNRFKAHLGKSAHWLKKPEAMLVDGMWDDHESVLMNTPPTLSTNLSRRSSLPSTQSLDSVPFYDEMSPLALPAVSIPMPQGYQMPTFTIPSFDLRDRPEQTSQQVVHPQHRFLLRAAQRILNFISTGKKEAVPVAMLRQFEEREQRFHFLTSSTGRGYCCTSSLPEFGGSFGKLRYAVCLETGRAFAIKEVRFPAAMVRKLIDRKLPKTGHSEISGLLNELSLMQAIEPDLEVHDAIEVQDKLYIVMDQLCGDCLDYNGIPQHIRVYFVYSMMQQVARALQRCHQAGFIHHDVKVENCLYREDGRVFLSDYGLAMPRYATEDKRFGTTHFPPEVLIDYPASASGYDTPIDIWALGVTFLTFFMEQDGIMPMRLWGHRRESDWQMQLHADEYAQWFAYVVRDNILDLERLKEHERYPNYATYSQFVADLFPMHPEIVSFVITRLLHPLPERRPSAQEVAECFEAITQAASESVQTNYARWFQEFTSMRGQRRQQLNQILRMLAMQRAYDSGHIGHWQT